MAGKNVTVSPLAPKRVPKMPPVPGVTFATAEAGVKYQNRTDVLLVSMVPGTTAAGVFTRSKCPSAPVDWCRAHLQQGSARGLLVNSGNANAFTGAKGVATVTHTAAIAAKALGCEPSEIFLASTGVIGEPLDAAKFDPVMPGLVARAADGPWIDAAKAIMTTDTFPKVATARAMVGGVEAVICGMAKGAGMIAPDMATMLSFIFTDAAITAPVLQGLLKAGTDRSFNCVTVDGDTSTSDTLMLFATGEATKRGQQPVSEAKDPALGPFRRALNKLMLDLAQQVARDGEGARKLIEVRVTGAKSSRSAKRIANSIANSPLVKTAMAGEDANWGRVVMAVGKAGEPAMRDSLSISFGGIRVAHLGARDTGYDEAATSAYMTRDHIVITADLALGGGKARVFTCDLTKAYVEINGDYRS